MFSGEYKHNLDSKGRVTIPTNFRTKLGDVFYITSGLDNCLFIYTEEEWIKFQEKLLSANMGSKNQRRIQRLFQARSLESKVDKQGRVLIGAKHKAFAGLEKEVVFLGVGNRIEIWDAKTWDDYINDESIDFEEMIDSMEDFTL